MSKKKLCRLPDNRTIDTEDDYQLAYWTKQLGISRHRLLQAIKANGTSVSDVKRNLTNKYVTGRN